MREEIVLEQVEDVFKQRTVPPDILEYFKGHLRGTEQSERVFLRRQVVEWQKQYTLSQNRLDKLMDLLLDDAIDRKDFEDKKASIRQEQIALENRIKSARGADETFKEAMLAILSIAAEAHDLFKSSTVEEKRRLINFLFANLELKGTTLCYSLRKPFDQMLDLTDMKKWRAREDSNSRHLAPETSALSPELRARNTD